MRVVRRVLLKSCAASFLVYLCPLIGPHAFWLLGIQLVIGISRRPPAWWAVDLAVALLGNERFAHNELDGPHSRVEVRLVSKDPTN